MDTCSEPGCSEIGNRQMYDGTPYCPAHYSQRYLANNLNEFNREYDSWVKGTSPSNLMLRVAGHLANDYWSVTSGMITGARLRSRGFNFKKTPEGFTFEITRHPGAFKNGFVSKLIVQTWEVKIAAKTIAEVEERPWQEGDHD